MIKKTITIGKVEQLLSEGKIVKVKTSNDEYTIIKKFINKGIQPTFEVILDNDWSIKVTNHHRFFTNEGWLFLKDITNQTILCDDNQYHVIKSVTYIGELEIVDITCSNTEESYFGNHFLNHNSGKSLLSAHLLSETQKRDGVAILYDTENAVSTDFFKAVGVNTDKLIYIPSDTVEGIFESIENIVNKIKANTSSEKKLVTIVIDSIAGATTLVEQESNFEKDGWSTSKAIVLSKAMRKITHLIAKERVILIITHQFREKLGCVNPETTNVIIRKPI